MKSESNQSLVPIIVYFTPEFNNPIISEEDLIGGDLNKIINSKSQDIKDLIAKINEFCFSNGINPESIFYLFEVGFTTEFPLEKTSSLEALKSEPLMRYLPCPQKHRSPPKSLLHNGS